MKKKHYHLLRAWLYVASAFIILSVPLWNELDEIGFIFTFLIVLLFGWLSYTNFKSSITAKEEERAYAPSANATIEEQVKFYKRYIHLSLLAFPLLTLITIFDLNELESGSKQRISLWAPISFLYEQFGYWAAILSIPVLGLIVVLLFIRKIRTVNKLSGQEKI
ncbi:MAG TPA: hypothetical protein VGC65_09540 [Bacteroidia bacterium]|jgi:hypothetical protein